jgi:hypothetical protein
MGIGCAGRRRRQLSKVEPDQLGRNGSILAADTTISTEMVESAEFSPPGENRARFG